MSDSSTPPLAITSYIPGVPAYDPRWPDSGPTDRASTIDKLPNPEFIKVHELPLRSPGGLHFQHPEARWVVLEIDPADYASTGGLVSFERGYVVFNGSALQACDYLRSRGLPVPSSYGQVLDVRDWGAGSVGDRGIIIGGYQCSLRAADDSLAFGQDGKIVAGDRSFALSKFGHVEAGENGTAITVDGKVAHAGNGGLALAYECGEATVGEYGIAIADTGGLATCGEAGIAIGIFGGDATAGARGIALCHGPNGLGGSALAGDRGLAISGGENSIVQAGKGGVLVMTWRDGERLRVTVASVGENGIEPNTPYTLDEHHRFVRVSSMSAVSDE